MSSSAAAPPRPGRIARRVGLVLIILSIVLGACAVFFGVRSVRDAVSDLSDTHVYETPLDTTVELDSGDNDVYQLVNGSSATLAPSQVHVTGPDGSAVSTRLPSGSQHITIDNSRYEAAVSFNAPTKGNYHIVVDGNVGAVLITRAVTAALLGVVVWVFVGLFAGLLFVIGLIVLIIGLTRRSKPTSNYPSNYPPTYPQQGYPQPGYSPGYPPPGYAPPGYPQQGNPQQGNPQQGNPQQGHPR